MTHRNDFLPTMLCALLAGCGAEDPVTGADDESGEDGGDADPDDDDDDDDGMFVDCGNDSIEEGEECDGLELGGASCTDVGPYAGGMLACGATCTLDETGCEVEPGAALVTINEVTSDSVVEGPFAAGPSDAIEIHNAGEGAADLSGWLLSDDPELPPERTFVIPEGTSLAPGEFVVFVSLDPDTMEGDYPFGVSDSSEETLTLADATGQEIDSVLVDGYRAVVSYCRLPDGNGPWDLCEQTFGETNQLAAFACGNGVVEEDEVCDSGDLSGATCDSLGLGYTGGALACSGKCLHDARACTTTSDIVINELEVIDDDLEIYNGGDADADLSGWVLTDDLVDANYDAQTDDAELVFPPGTILEPGGYLVVPVGIGPGQHPFGLGTQGDTVALVDPASLTIIDQVTYAQGQAMVSYCRQPNGPGGDWTDDCPPSIGAAN